MKVSVLLPVRDAADTLPAALDSLRWQTRRPDEVVVVDDGSSDASPEILARARRWLPLQVLRRDGPGDLVAALELGRSAAAGDCVMRLDADDLAHPRRLEWSLELLADPRLAAVGTLVRSFPAQQVQPGRRRYDAWLNGLRTSADMARERFVESPLAHPSVTFRASAVSEVGGYRSLAGPEDYDLWLRLVGAGWRLGKVPRIGLFWREGAQRASRQDPRYGRRGFAQVRAAAIARLLEGRRRPAAIVGAGAAGRRLARLLQAEGVEVRRFLDIDPAKLGRRPAGVPVVEHSVGLKEADGAVLFSAVNAWGARGRVRRLLEASGKREGEDFFLAG